jgi:hypothetical protein
MSEERDELRAMERKLRRELADVPASDPERWDEVANQLISVRSLLAVDAIATRALLESQEDDDVL